MSIIELKHITKQFPGIKANDNISIDLQKGEIHAILGENGSGKSTLMSILFGLYTPDNGTICLKGKSTVIANPQIANKLGIGMVHQHFQLIDEFTVTENIILGVEPTQSFFRVNIQKAAEKIHEISTQYGLEINPYAKIKDLPVSLQQRVEILKMLYKNAEVMIFDEPTAVLVPSEIQELLNILKNLVKEGKSIFLITHKLYEIIQIADRCSVLSHGKHVGTVHINETTETQLAYMMIGREVNLEIKKQKIPSSNTIFKVHNMSAISKKKIPLLQDINIEIKAGEILGIAGVAGNGQMELVQAIMGFLPIHSGHITLGNTNIEHFSIRHRIESGIGLIPEDRQKHGLVLDFTLSENLGLKNYYQPPYSHKGFLRFDTFNSVGELLIQKFDIRSSEGKSSIVRTMSGGNQQKAIIAREIHRSPKLLLIVQPTRGLDIGAIEYIHKRIIQEREKGNAILLVSMELEEILSLSDRIAIMFNGKIDNTLDNNEIDPTLLGLMMIGKKV